MKVSNKVIFNAREPLKRLLGIKLPVLVGYELLKIERQIASQWEIIDRLRNDLIKRYGEEVPVGPPGDYSIKSTDKGFEKFSKELEKLFDEGIDITFKVVLLPRNIQIEPFVLMALEQFIVIEGTQAKKKRK